MRVGVGLCLIGSLVSGGLVAAQAPSSASTSSVPTLKVNTQLTLVDVTVTDSKGQPVHGLTRADFTVKEDGKPQPIRNFEEYGDGKATAEAAAPPLPPDVYSNQQSSRATTQAVNILLFDQVATGISYGLQPDQQILKDAKKASAQYLETMPPGTQVTVLQMDGSGLHLVQRLTSDQKLLLAAVNSIALRLVPQSYWDPRPFPIFPQLCDAMNFQSEQALNAMNQVAAFVTSIPGRKNLIWFTLGVPWLVNYQPFSRFQVITCLRDETTELQRAYGRLTAARVAAYPLDPRGLLLDPASNVDDGASHPPPGLGDISRKFGIAVLTDNGSLDDMAKATGGKARYSNNDLAGLLRDDAATGADYYALSYVPPLSKYDGKYHTIEVKVDRPGVQLEYRRGYTSLDLDGPVLETGHGKTALPKDSFHTAMGYGGPAATQVGFAVRAVPSTAARKPGDPPVIGTPNAELKGKPLVRYSFAFDLPRDKITLVEQPDGTRKGSFELAIAAYDVQGRVLNSLDEKRSFVLKPDAVAGFLQKPFLVPVEIDLPAGNVSVRAGVLDLPSDEMGVVDIPLKVAAP